MDWIKLLKSIGVALLCLLLIAVFLAWVYWGYKDWRWFVGGAGLIVFSCFVSYIYDRMD